jgi:hypothetical protein
LTASEPSLAVISSILSLSVHPACQPIDAWHQQISRFYGQHHQLLKGGSFFEWYQPEFWQALRPCYEEGVQKEDIPVLEISLCVPPIGRQKLGILPKIHAKAPEQIAHSGSAASMHSGHNNHADPFL